ncbi:class IV adenylate cyclase [Paucibacter sp. KCTC 42545]|uniref:class IV adenylate cyclase n=1 Tax=Paucibacter sp. KCTC 42545 TaxID=1768242 RepID=UPI000733B482|nr:class IV adenylate cyclase [Paucibacter sp. KCTC 42545]ALT80029.1 adenylate cyclase [Paucibacter sp. KCTC 42545]
MARNIEIKAHVKDLEAVAAAAAKLAGAAPSLIEQDDTFFSCPAGRLKLRSFVDGSGVLIFYQRADQAGPKECFYALSETADAASLRETLSLAYGQVGRVRKLRRLFIVGRTRVHLDQVEGLGSFIELEVVLGEHEAAEQGVEQAHALMQQLGIASEDLLETAYVDLLADSAKAAQA